MEKLSDLKPKTLNFEVGELPLTFKPYSLASIAKEEEIFGTLKGFSDALKTFDFEKLSLLAWYQMDFKSQKKVIESVECSYVDAVSGQEVEKKLTPIEKFRVLFSSISEQMAMLKNLMNCRGMNMPDIDDQKKMTVWSEQIDKIADSTGLKSLIE